jgi:hypothetical protein
MIVLLVVLSCILFGPAPAQAQGDPDPSQHMMSDAPALHVRGFTDIDFSQTDNPESPDGFSLGQFAAHLSASLGSKVSFFGETSATAHSSNFTVEIERAILRYDYNDRFKISVGRYHTPINYWNTAFHHGLWLQTTISRPDMIRGGGTFQPVHFVGVLAEGTVGPSAAGLGYNLGVGNGRGAVLSRAGDAGDVNRNRAWLAKLYARPAALYGLEVGGAVYHDKIALVESDGVPELITSAYAALTTETPEVIAEFANVRHHDPATDRDYNTQAFYVQVASRLGAASRWKPYARYEKALGDTFEPVLGDISGSTATAGVRFELTDTAAVKAEYRHMRDLHDAGVNGVYLQTAFTF